MNKTRHALTTGLKLAVCLFAILAIGYTQMVTEGLGGGYGGPSLHFQARGDFWSVPAPEFYSRIEQEMRMVLTALLLLLLIAGWRWWHKVWTEALQRERRLAAELRPMYRLVSSPQRLTKKRKPYPSGAPAWH